MVIVLNFIVTIIIAVLGAYWISYFKRKGENLAKKEDLTDITTTVEQIKQDLSTRSLKMLKNYDTELEAVKLISGFIIEMDVLIGRLSTRPYLKSVTKKQHAIDIQNLYDALIKFQPKFNEYKIFLDDKLVTRLDILIGSIFIIYAKLTPSSDEELKKIDSTSSAFNAMRDDIPPLLMEIKDDLEKILGRK